MPACSCESVLAAALCSDSFIFTVAKMKGSFEPSKSTFQRQTELAKSTLQRQNEPAKSNLQRQHYICSVKNEYSFEPAKSSLQPHTEQVNQLCNIKTALQFVAFLQLSGAVKEILRHESPLQRQITTVSTPQEQQVLLQLTPFHRGEVTLDAADGTLKNPN